jgi:MFS family permease
MSGFHVNSCALPSSPRISLGIVIAGMLGLVIAMGIGRFAYTPVLPFMQRDLGLDYATGGWIAGTNLVGYLVGATWAFLIPSSARSHKIAAIMLLTSLLGSYTMGMTQSVMLWSLIRFAAGIASGMLFVYVASEATQRLMERGRGNWAGAIYGGVGCGIILTGVCAPWFDNLAPIGDGWKIAWLGFGGVATVAAALALFLNAQTHHPASALTEHKHPPLPWPRLYMIAIAYFFEALGYIVSATFLVTIITTLPAVADLAPWAWVISGIAAVPSTLLWPWLGRKIGVKWAMSAAYMLQAAGMLVCMQASTMIEVVFVAVSFGGTFLGIVALMMAEGGRRSPPNSRRITAMLTAGYAVGQVIAPIVAGWIADTSQSFAIPLAMAAGCVGIGLLFIVFDRNYDISFPTTGD